MSRILGVSLLGGTLLALAGIAVHAARRKRREEPLPVRHPPADASIAKAAGRFYAGAAVLSFSVLADSTLEHYRGSFHNRGMFIAPVVSAVTLATNFRAARRPVRPGTGRIAVSAIALMTGIAGTGFHLYNVGKREGGFRFLNLFYGAPLAAPGAIGAAGAFGLAATLLVADPEPGRARILGLPAGALLAVATAAGLTGTVAEVVLLHFRGAFQDPFMYVPVTLPPVAATVLVAAALNPDPARCRAARRLLGATALMGLTGMGFHAYGIHRNMGGWRNWSQMILQGPPLPAPPGFTGLALAGLGAVALLERGAR